VEHQFAWTREAVQAVKLGTEEARKKYEDMYFKNRDYDGQNRNSPTASANMITDPQAEQQAEPAKPEILAIPEKTLGDPPTKGKKKKPVALLVNIVEEGHKNNKSAYDALKEAGWVGSIQEYL
jgi:hypothetical protein